MAYIVSLVQISCSCSAILTVLTAQRWGMQGIPLNLSDSFLLS